MAISIDWGTGVISVPQSYLTLLGGTLYELDTEQFRLDLKALEASEEGIVFTDTHIHNTEYVISGDTYARAIQMLPPYSVEFEAGLYRVKLVGSNNNILDVAVLNGVSIAPTNSAGLIKGEGGGLTKVDVQDAMTDQGYTTGRALNLDNLDDSVAAARADVAGVSTDVGAVQSTVDGIDTAVGTLPGDILEENVLSHAGVAGSLAESITLMMGALHLNAVVDDFVYDTNNKLIGATVWVYNSKANATTHNEATGLVHKYTMDAAHVSDLANLFRLVVDS